MQLHLLWLHNPSAWLWASRLCCTCCVEWSHIKWNVVLQAIHLTTVEREIHIAGRLEYAVNSLMRLSRDWPYPASCNLPTCGMPILIIDNHGTACYITLTGMEKCGKVQRKSRITGLLFCPFRAKAQKCGGGAKWQACRFDPFDRNPKIREQRKRTTMTGLSFWPFL